MSQATTIAAITSAEEKLMFARTITTTLLFLTLMLGALSGCNTVAGIGKDIERGGEKVHDAAKDVQKKL